jgi:hypothetical protein
MVRHIRVCLFCFAVLASVFWRPRTAGATVWVRMELGEVVRRSDAIVLGRVEAASAHWEGGRIVSDVAVRVEDRLKGNAGALLHVVHSGGKVGDIVMRVLGAPEFRVGQRAILFLAKTGEAHRVVGLAQGKVDVEHLPGGDVVRWEGDALLPLDRALDKIRAAVQAARR